jgi:hypothetical protein
MQSYCAVISVQWEVTANMLYSYEDYAEMHFLYKFCNINSTAAVEE